MHKPGVASPRLSRRDAMHVLNTVLSQPFFVPDLGTSTTQLLVSGKVTALIDTLERMTALGSHHAAVFLAALLVKGAIGSRADLGRAEILCIEPARHGDPYAQYVLAWVCKMSDRDAEALKWLTPSAKSLFPPAMVDMGRFMVEGAGFKSSDPHTALEVFCDAHRIGHRMALLYMSEICRRGYVGWYRMPLGFMLWPFAFLRAVAFSRRNPLSEKASVMLARTDLPPLFRRPEST